MRLLLDTHVLLWAVNGEENASAAVRDAVRDPANELFISIASFWEAAIKIGNGKLIVPGGSVTTLIDFAATLGATTLAITETHLRLLEALPKLHRDPFDRLIVVQARAEALRLVSADRLILQYEPHAIR
jgi:PIN domain nuclease of toxin-antitoxin system